MRRGLDSIDGHIDRIYHMASPASPVGYVKHQVATLKVNSQGTWNLLELAADQILVNAIAPGPIVAPDGTSDTDAEAVERATPLGRWGGELEIAKAVLAFVELDFVTGETFRVDGGRHVK